MTYIKMTKTFNNLICFESQLCFEKEVGPEVFSYPPYAYM